MNNLKRRRAKYKRIPVNVSVIERLICFSSSIQKEKHMKLYLGTHGLYLIVLGQEIGLREKEKMCNKRLKTRTRTLDTVINMCINMFSEGWHLNNNFIGLFKSKLALLFFRMDRNKHLKYTTWIELSDVIQDHCCKTFSIKVRYNIYCFIIWELFSRFMSGDVAQNRWDFPIHWS